MSKGIGAIAFFMLVGLISVVSVFMFFIFFKAHLTSIAVDTNSINRYQEIPTAALGVSLFSDKSPGGPDTRPKTEINCFSGNGPSGSHEPNVHICTKQVSLYFNKVASGIGPKILADDACGVLDSNCDAASLERLRDGLRLSLPDRCYRYSLETSDGPEENTDVLEGTGCEQYSSGTVTYKLNEIYPIPIFFGGVPAVAIQRLFIDDVVTNGERPFSNWPSYTTNFLFKGSAAVVDEPPGVGG